MKDRPGVRAREGREILVRDDVGAGFDLVLDDGSEGRCGGQLAQQFDAFEREVHVPLGRQIVGLDQRCYHRVRRSDLQMAAAGRPARVDPQQKPGKRVGAHHLALSRRHTGVADGAEIELQIGTLDVRGRAYETASLIDAQGERAAAHQQELQSDPELAMPWPEDLVERRHMGAIEVVDAEMVLQVLSNMGCVQENVDAEVPEHLPRSYPR